MSYFSIDELCHSETAVEKGIDNTPNHVQSAHLYCLIVHLLDPIREFVGHPILVTSGFRCPELNKLVGGKPQSQHLLGQAADIVCAELNSDLLYEEILKSDIEFDQLILENVGGKKWVHVSYHQNNNRKQAFKIG